MKKGLIAVIVSIVILALVFGTMAFMRTGNPHVEIETNRGTIIVELDRGAAPVTVNNFMEYVDEGFYSGTVFHRVIDGFMIQGGGFTEAGSQKRPKDPIILEKTGLTNDRGTIAMARTIVENSATSQFFINVADNDFLNPAPGNPGYAVFGRVVEGMGVVDQIKGVPTTTKNGLSDWPQEDVIILSIKKR